MSKRGADEYITKEHGSTPNTEAEINKVKMATAAQLAKRKMAVPKSRAGRSGQSPMPGASPANPFTNANAFGAPQSDQQSTFASPGTLTFGASQSFPAGDTSNSGFQFSVPGQSSSFTFGQPAPNNPFASLNGSAGNQQGSGQDSNDTIMESPQKKPAFGSTMFGANSIDSNTQSTGFVFGQTTSQPSSAQPTPAFGQSQGFGSGSSTALFGPSISKPSESKPTPNLFAQPAQSDKSISSPGTFGQSGSLEPPKKTSGFNFGQPAASTPSSTPPAFSFSQPVSNGASATPSFKFGEISNQPATSRPSSGDNVPTSAPMFGSISSTSQSASSTPPFGLASAAPSGTAFAGFQSPKATSPTPSSATTLSSEQPKSSLFGQPVPNSPQVPPSAPSVTEQQPQSNPFAGLFAQSTAKQSRVSSTSAADTQKPLFSFSAPSQPSGLFSLPKDNSIVEASQTSQEVSKKPLFSFAAPANQSTPTLFSSKPASDTPPSTMNPFANLSESKPQSSEPKTQIPSFGMSQQAAGKDQTSSAALSTFGKSASDNPQPADSSTSNGSKSNGTSSFDKSRMIDSAPSSSHFGGDQNLQKSKASETSLFGGFGTSVSEKPPQSTVDHSAPVSQATSNHSNTILSHKNQSVAVDGPERTVNTFPPTRIPPYLNGDDYKSYDNNFRLHSLNREFQKRIASLDPSREDFENIVRNYVAARESIGESIGLYTRNIAGMKRKADEDDDRHKADEKSVKRNKPVEEASSKPSFGTSAGSGSVFQPVPSSASKPTTTFPNVPKSVNASPAKASTSSLFSSMIPDNKSTSNDQSFINPFANLPTTKATSVNSSAPPPSYTFESMKATAPPAESTTPTKSPPKKAGFEMPKFAAPVGGSNFMDAFKKQSEASVAKFAKEAKAKRKAEEFDSDEDDEEEWNRKYEEEERAKKAKVDAIAQKGFMPVFTNGNTTPAKSSFNFGTSVNASTTTPNPTGFTGFGSHEIGKSSAQPIDVSDNDASGEEEDEEENDDEENGSGDPHDDGDEEEEEEADEDDLPEDEVEAENDNEAEDEDLQTALANSRNRGRSLFDRVTPNPSVQKDSTALLSAGTTLGNDVPKQTNAFGNIFGRSTTDAPAVSSFTSASLKEPYVPSKTFNFTPTPPINSPAPVLGASIFAGGTMKDGPISGEGLFGSRPSTPSNVDKPKSNPFANLGTTTPSNNLGLDHTWKKGSEIKFGTSTTEAPSVSITEPSPRRDEAKPFGSLFGATTSSANDSSNKGNLGFIFGQTPAPGFLAATSHLAGGSGTNSGFSSRATSPGTTDNESVATNEEDFSHDTQVSLMETRPGEENEIVLLEVRSKALRFYKEDEIEGTKLIKGWNAVGVGIVRLLKHKESGKARIVMRAEPNANIILNTNLQPAVTYKYAPAKDAGIVSFTVFTSEGGQGWTLKMKSQQQAQELAKLMDANKTPSK